MSCFVCKGPLSFYFVKDFSGECDLNEVEYWRCQDCGMAISKTHFEMSEQDWQKLNTRYHLQYQGSDFFADDPRWLSRLTAQSETISALAHLGVLPRDLPWIDYECGDGKLANMLKSEGIEVLKFERYMPQHGSGYVGEEALNEKFSMVINTSVFEHVREIEALDEIAGLVDSSGVLGLHVMVRDAIPCDPTWFYLLPVHCAFYSNRSMEILFDRWGFASSIYHVPSRMWFWFRSHDRRATEYVAKQQERAPGDYYCKTGFVDYWK